MWILYVQSSFLFIDGVMVIWIVSFILCTLYFLFLDRYRDDHVISALSESSSS
jgi:beta-lactamase regulating signal transducer with metallopeptidase domain